MIEKICGVHKRPSKIVNRLEKYIKRYNTKESDIWCNHGNWQGKLEYASKEQYGEGIMATFEGINVRIPKKIDEYLTQKYGDWKSDLPEDEKQGHHYHYICDTARSYKEYIVKTSKHSVEFAKQS